MATCPGCRKALNTEPERRLGACRRCLDITPDEFAQLTTETGHNQA